MRTRWMLAAASLSLLAGCATSFTGAAYVPDGPLGCERQCTEWGLEFGGMVAMGEYSTACLCLPSDSASDSKGAAAGAIAGGVAGVIMQMQAAQQQAAASALR